MTVRWLLVGCLVAVVTGLAAQTGGGQSGTTWRTLNGDIVIDNIGRHSVKGGSEKIEIEFSGSPLRGQSRAQGLRFVSGVLTGDLVQNASQDWYLVEGRLEGNVVVTQSTDRESYELSTGVVSLAENANRTQTTLTIPGRFTLTGSGNRSITAGSGRADFKVVGGQRSLTTLQLNGSYSANVAQTLDGNIRRTYTATGATATVTSQPTTEKIDSPQGLNFRLVDDGRLDREDQVLDLKSSGGTIVLPKTQQGRPIRSADLKGRVNLQADSWAVVGENADGSDKWEKVKITASGDRLTFSEKGELKLEGAVEFRIDGSRGFEGSGDVLSVQFDDEMNLESWATSGGPGTIRGYKPDGGLAVR